MKFIDVINQIRLRTTFFPPSPANHIAIHLYGGDLPDDFLNHAKISFPSPVTT